MAEGETGGAGSKKPRAKRASATSAAKPAAPKKASAASPGASAPRAAPEAKPARAKKAAPAVPTKTGAKAPAAAVAAKPASPTPVTKPPASRAKSQTSTPSKPTAKAKVAAPPKPATPVKAASAGQAPRSKPAVEERPAKPATARRSAPRKTAATAPAKSDAPAQVALDLAKATAAGTPPPAPAKEATHPAAPARPAHAPGKTADDAPGNVMERWGDASARLYDALSRAAQRQSGQPRYPLWDPLGLSTTAGDLALAFLREPARMMKANAGLATDLSELWRRSLTRLAGEDSEPMIAPSAGDKRFKDPRWSENLALDFLKQAYLLGSRRLIDAVEELDDAMDPHHHDKALFFAQQVADAFAPTNFAASNPVVLEETLNTRGENLLKGFENFVADLERGEGMLSITQTDMDSFEVGKNVATTPGQVIFENDVIQVIQYAPSTPKVDARPLLIFPPWINKFYILDLRPENSFVKWAVDQGLSVFLVSWRNPGPEQRDKGFEDYMREGIFAAVDATLSQTGEKQVDAIGYCIGGTLLSSTLALMAKRKDVRIASATFFAAQTDFKEAGDLQIFIDDEQLEHLASRMDAHGGVLDAGAMATAFNMLRANDLIWSFVVNNYLMGRDARQFDLLFWNADATRLPKELHLYYLRRFYLNNDLAEERLTLDGEKIRLGDVKIPIFMQSSRADHIAPFKSVYRGARLFGGPVRFMLAGSGHIAGVINHPDAKKYQHWVRTGDLPATADDWLQGAEERPGSWWNEWMSWLRGLRSGQVDARDPTKGPLKPIEPAPGSYVKVMAA